MWDFVAFLVVSCVVVLSVFVGADVNRQNRQRIRHLKRYIPGQKLRVEIPAADCLIFDEGKYRLIYGDAVIVFALVTEEVW